MARFRLPSTPVTQHIHAQLPPLTRNISTVLMLCVCAIIFVLAAIFGVSYHAALDVIDRSSLKNAHIQATVLSHDIAQILNAARSHLLTLAAGTITPDELTRRLQFRSAAGLGTLVREVAFTGVGSGAENFLLVTVGKEVAHVPREIALEAHGSPFQAFSSERRPGVVQIAAAQDVTYTMIQVEGVLQSVNLQVLRMSTPVFTVEGVFIGQLMLSLDLHALRDTLTLFASENSPLSVARGERPMLRSAYFDREGWLLFESEDTNTTDPPLSVNGVRSGLHGDAGRSTMSGAFRPGPSYSEYWGMVQAVSRGYASGDSGSFIPDTAVTNAALAAPRNGETPQDKPVENRWFNWYSGPYRNAIATYAPVFFWSAPGEQPTVVGGILVLDSSYGSAQATVGLFNVYAIVSMVAFALLVLGAWLLCRAFAQPIGKLAEEVEGLCLSHAHEHGNGEIVKILTRADTSPAAVLMRADNAFERLRTGINALAHGMHHLESTGRSRRNAARHQRAREVIALPPMPEPQGDEPRELMFVGGSAAMQTLRAQIAKIAAVQADVLLIGETGTGKEVACASLHRQSRGRNSPFISINCGALDENLLMDTLFGHVKGAYTEAKAERKGAFVAAEGGTLMLDEVGNASLRVQQALLRALSTRCIRPLGSDTDVPFNARIVAATNVDLHEMAERGEFREDLYYRLAVITLRTPPLRAHKEDIPLLAAHCLGLACTELERPPVQLSRGALDKLTEYDWPGNVRQFKNVIKRAVAFADGGVLYAEDLAFGVAGAETKGSEPPAYTASPERDFAAAPGMPDMPTVPDVPDVPSMPAFSGDTAPAMPLPDTRVAAMADTPNVAEREALPPSPGGRPRQVDSRQGPPRLNARQATALPHIRAFGSISRQEYQDIIANGLSVRTAQYDLQDLARKGLVYKVGNGPASRYHLSPGAGGHTGETA